MPQTRVGAGLMAALAAVPDPRKRRSIRYQVNAIVKLAVMAGCRSFAAIGEWAADASAPDEVVVLQVAVDVCRAVRAVRRGR
jgi:hypothetical protein